MAARARLMATTDVKPDCARVSRSTLVLTGERELDHVVPVDTSLEYARLIKGAQSRVLERTGHLGAMTRPDAFAAAITSFVAGINNHAAA
jgi:pimeloyl-ACP methyl ester carboxylesterase